MRGRRRRQATLTLGNLLALLAVGVLLGLLTDLSSRELVTATAVIGGALAIGFEVFSDRRARRAWEKVRRPGS